MTDKQIMIDGVDVSGCDELVNGCDCYLTEEHDYRATNPYSYDKCSEYSDCLFKQLARKTQECEKLKEEIKRNGFGCFNIEMAEQLDQPKSLIKKYEECNKYLVEENGKTYTRLEYKLLRTLTEIKELLLKTPTDSQMYCVNAKSVILQKISECEVEE